MKWYIGRLDDRYPQNHIGLARDDGASLLMMCCTYSSVKEQERST
jgi:hypothetical protein